MQYHLHSLEGNALPVKHESAADVQIESDTYAASVWHSQPQCPQAN